MTLPRIIRNFAHNSSEMEHRMEKEGTICFIGAGNVATHLGLALLQTRYTLTGIYSQTLAHAEYLSAKLGTHTVCTDRLDQLPQADIYIFMVKDAVLDSVAQQLSDTLPDAVIHSALFIHTAGSMPMDTLSRLFTHAAVMYPLQSFSKDAILDFSEIPLFLETSDSEAQEAAEHLAHALSKQVSQLNSDGRKVLHLAGVFANNFTNHCIALAHDLLKESDIDPQCLHAIIQETIRKALSMDPHEAQTGPARRYDTNVMDKHLQMLQDHPELQDVYSIMSRSIHQHFSTHP